MRTFVACLTTALILGAVSLMAGQSPAPGISDEDLLAGFKNSSRWLTYSGDYRSERLFVQSRVCYRITPRIYREEVLK